MLNKEGFHVTTSTYLQVSLLFCCELSVLQCNLVERVVFLGVVTFIKDLYATNKNYKDEQTAIGTSSHLTAAKQLLYRYVVELATSSTRMCMLNCSEVLHMQTVYSLSLDHSAAATLQVHSGQQWYLKSACCTE